MRETIHARGGKSYASAFRRCFRQAHRVSRRLVAEHIPRGDGHLREVLRFALQHQITSEYPFVFRYSFCEEEQDCQRVARLGGAVHLLQSATLITDDVFDFADVRYHHPTIHRRYDVSHAIVAAEVLQSIAMQCINAELERPGFHNRVLVLNLFHQIVKDLYAGQHLDVCSTANLQVTTRDYRRVIELGAGRFFANLARGAALLRGKARAHVESLAAFGYHYGMGLFITDDIIDITQERALTGKTFAPDLKNRRMRLPMILALQSGSRKDARWLREFLHSEDNSRTVLLEAANRIQQSGALRACQAIANDYLRRSIESLATMEGSPTARSLTWLSQRLLRPERTGDRDVHIVLPLAFRRPQPAPPSY